MLSPMSMRPQSAKIVHINVQDLSNHWHRLTVTKRSIATDDIDAPPQQPAVASDRSAHGCLIDCDAWSFRYLLSEVLARRRGRLQFIRLAQCCALNSQPVVVRLHPPAKEVIDYGWNELNERTAFTHQELDHLTSWLSTLGGGYSALGDSMDQCAEIAGRISVYQFRLALQFGDPPLVARSKLYMALALIQKRRLRVAKHLTRRVYHESLADRDVDERLLNMCHGIWLKLQWAYTQRGVRAA